MVGFDERWRYRLFLLKRTKPIIIGLGLLVFVLFLGFFGTYVSRSPTEINLSNRLLPPSATNPFGTDKYGRDLLSRIIYGTRYTMVGATVSVFLALLIGVPLGGISGFSGGKIDMVLMRIADVMLAFPSLLMAMIISAALGPSIVNAAISLGIAGIPFYMRLVRSKVLSVKEMEYVEAAKAIGAPPWRIFFLHVLPNSIAPVFTAAFVGIGTSILWITGLSFLGLGAQPPTPEWGLMILEGREYILTGKWWLATFPGIFIAISIAAFNLIGDGLRDILSPKLRIT